MQCLHSARTSFSHTFFVVRPHVHGTPDVPADVMQYLTALYEVRRSVETKFPAPDFSLFFWYTCNDRKLFWGFWLANVLLLLEGFNEHLARTMYTEIVVRVSRTNVFP